MLVDTNKTWRSLNKMLHVVLANITVAVSSVVNSKTHACGRVGHRGCLQARHGTVHETEPKGGAAGACRAEAASFIGMRARPGAGAG